jgi:hypothetical protein
MATKEEKPAQEGKTPAEAPETRSAGKSEAQAHILRPKGEPRFMPPDYTISLAAKGGTDRWLMNPGTQRVHSMRGFEDTYVDIIDYILRITHRIWEGRRLAGHPRQRQIGQGPLHGFLARRGGKIGGKLGADRYLGLFGAGRLRRGKSAQVHRVQAASVF